MNAASDGEEALHCIQEHKFDMMIADLNMPGMNGIELVKEIRKMPGHRFMPIVMLTSEKNIDKRREAKDAGASTWLIKPFKNETLLSITRMICPNAP